MLSQNNGLLMIKLLKNEGSQIESLTTTHGLHQLISDPTHILPNSSSCIDLLFTDQPNLAIDSIVHHSLNSNFHHQLTHCKFNLVIQYPPSYERLTWDYKKVNTISKKRLNKYTSTHYLSKNELMNRFKYLL